MKPFTEKDKESISLAIKTEKTKKKAVEKEVENLLKSL